MTRKTHKLRKVLTLAACAVLLVSVSIMGTIAYLTDSEGVTNTFTVGNVQIKLDEADVDLYGEIDGEARAQKNEYKLLPGHTYIKDPTVTVEAGSEESYIRMIVTISDIADLKAALGNDFLPQYFVNGWDSTKWVTTGTILETNDTCVYEFRYFETVNTLDGKDLVLDALFDEIFMPESVTNEQLAELEELEINIVAHAIQADGFEDEDAAWGAWE